MIKYNNNTINDWNFGTSNLIKVYRNNAIVFYKVSGESPTPEYKVCFAVVEDISKYTDREFDDVYDNATEKWYKLNNLNQYEQYGVYGSGRTICDSSASRLPQGYTEVEYIENVSPNMAYIDTNFQPNQDTRILTDIQIVTSTNYGKLFSSGQWDRINGIQLQYEVGATGTLLIDWGTATSHYNTNINGDYNRHTYDWDKNNFYLDGTLIGSTTYGNFQCTCNLLIFMASSSSCVPTMYSGEVEFAKLFSFKIYDDGTLVRDLVPCKRDSDGKYGMYDIVNDVFYTSPNNVDFIGGDPITPTDCVTTYDGKLTIDDETSPSRLPQGYTEVEYIENTSTAYIDTNLQLYSSTTDSFEIESKLIAAKHDSQSYQNVFSCMSEDGEPYQGFTYRYQASSLVGTSIPNGQNTFTIVNNEDSTQTVTVTSSSSQRTYTHTYPLTLFCGLNSSRNPFRWTNSKFYYCKIRMNDVLVRDLVPCKRDSDDKYGMYDIVNDVFYTSPNNVNFVGGAPVIEPTKTYEYEWNGSSWVNLGEVSGSSRVPSEYVELTYAQTSKILSTSSNAFTIPINLQTTNNYIFEFTPLNWGESYYGHILGGNDASTNFPKLGIFKVDNGWGTETKRFVSAFWNYNLESRNSSPGGNYRVYDNVRSRFTMNLHNYTVGQGADIKVENEGYETVTKTSTAVYRNGYSVTEGVYNIDIFSTSSNPSSTYIAKEQFHNLKVETNEGVAVYDYVPCKRKNDNTVGLYDIVNNAFYSPSAFTLTAGDEESYTTYPKYYSEKSDPLNDLTFDTLAEAQTYAYNNCVYDGMKATIDGDRYYFDSSDENGWVKILEYYKVEDVTPNGASGWTISGSDTYNPDSSYYDDFDLQTTSTSYATKIAKVTIYGYDHFTYYLRTSGYSNYCYVVATNVDEVSTPPSTMSYDSASAITNTYYWYKSPKSAVNLSNYRRVTYNNLDKTVEHTFYVYFYGRTYSSSVGNATILIPKEQKNENWEQVTFSASSNVASSRKNLYIDNNNSTSGGTEYWYYRWIVGLPSGSHSSYTNYSNYNYCPNATSSTFTSVAGEQRQVNFTYDNTSNKELSFRLTDGSNVLTPSDTVYYNMTYYNSCGVSSSSSNVAFPMFVNVKVGGRFRFASSSDRHYIYGYSPNISLNTDYYVDNYQNTFDITYTKLSDEAVTITYTTYDPSDVETPSFNTDITYPYNGGTTSSTTLTSFDAPYTYQYTVKQTNDKFSADSQSFTAGQAARTISFTLYPNNREFVTVADMEAYQYAWEGMTAYVGDTKYKYENGEWVENKHSLPDVPFVLNYNAKQYNASTHTIPYTEGALNAINAVITGTTANIIDHSSDGYIELTGSTSTTIRALVGTTNFSRSSSNPNITIICKAYTPGSSTEGNILSNRNESYNWMYRHKSTQLRFHGQSEQGSIAVSNTEPNTCSVRIDSNRLLKYNNWTQNTTSTHNSFNYGANSNGGALFSGYYSTSDEMWKGVFYWIYMSLNTLTDEQVQQVIDYNENL